MSVASSVASAAAPALGREKPSVLIVDDDPRGLAALESALTTEGYVIEKASSGPEALEKARQFRPDVMLLDVMMPDMDGFDVCRAVRSDARIAEMPIILVTALDDNDALLQGIDAGADELLTKPFNRLELRTRLRTLTRVNRYRRLVAEREHLEQTSNGVITVLTDILSLVDPVAFGRAQRIRERVREIGELVGVSPTWSVELAGLLSQIGVLTLPPEVLTKARGGQDLTGTEKSMLSRVPEIGRDLLVHIPSFHEVGELVRLQSARFDGLGVGNSHLRGDELPLGVRVLKVAIDQIRLESEGLAPTEAWSKLAEDSGAYDPDVLAAAEQIALGLSTRPPTTRVIARVGLMDLRLGWTLHQAVVAPDGTLLLGAGHTLTPAVLERIHNFAKVSGVRLPIVVERDEPVALAEPLLTS